MKISDFAPRTGALEYYLSGNNLTGIEVGTDVGAHAESLLTNCDIQKLYLVDTWENDYCRGYCEGRLSRWFHKIELLKGRSLEMQKKFLTNTFDFIYLDQQHDYQSVKSDLVGWWEKLKTGGIMALRNYAESNTELKKAADEFCIDKKFKVERYHGEIIIFK